VLALIVVSGLAIAACSSSGTTATTSAPPSGSLQQAVTKTLAAPSYTEVLSQSTPQGKQTDYLKYQAPDRLGGYIQSGSKRTYVYVIGSTEYESQAVPNGTSISQVAFQSQASQGVTALDPAHSYLPNANQSKHPTLSGNTYSFTLSNQGQTGVFTYTVNGQYVSTFTLKVSTASVRVDISAIGTSAPVALPSGVKISPASSVPTTAPSP
jgi:hypothetical protein